MHMMNNSTGTERHYKIEIEEHLDDRWQEWFEEATIDQTAIPFCKVSFKTKPLYMVC